MRRYISRETYIIEPSYLDAQVLSENVVIRRDTGQIRRNGSPPRLHSRAVPAIPTAQQETVMSIFGILGLIPMYSGDHLVVITGRERVGKLHEHEIWRMTGFKMLPLARSSMHLNEIQVTPVNIVGGDGVEGTRRGVFGCSSASVGVGHVLLFVQV
jgi:hypothetical protein